MKFSLFRTIYDARKPVDWIMISTGNVYVIFSLKPNENSTENTLCYPLVRIMLDKKRNLQTYFAVKDNYIVIAIRGCTNIVLFEW